VTAGGSAARAARIRVTALDDAPIRRQHVALLARPRGRGDHRRDEADRAGLRRARIRQEYGLKSPANPLGHVPVSGCRCRDHRTVIGSLLWARSATGSGRRGAILFAGMLFVTPRSAGRCPGTSGTC